MQASHLSPLPIAETMAGVSSSRRRCTSEPFYQIRCRGRISALPFSDLCHSPSTVCFAPLNSSGLVLPPTNLQANMANFPSSSDSHSCQSFEGKAVEKRKKHSGSSRRVSTNAQNLTRGHSTRNSNESGNRIVSLSRTLSRLGHSMRRRSIAPDQPVFATNFASLLENDASWLKSLDNLFESQQSPAKLKVILKVSEFSSSTSSVMKINEPRKLTSLQDPSGASSCGRIYAFNHIYVPGDPVKEINVNSLGGILKAVLGGCDGCVFTFGLAKTGKTYTMLGVDNSVDNFGVVPFAIAWLFNLIRSKQATTGTEISVFMSAVEVFDSGEVLRDLLAHVGNSSDVSNEAVDVNDEPVNGTYLRNQREVNICSPQEAGLYLDAAIASQTAPGRNRVAENLHVIFSFRLLQRQTNGQGSSRQGVSNWLRLIDFSSVRRSKSGSAMTFSGLTSIIQAVLSGRRDLPYRDKKITKLILKSLGGASCHVCMITHVSLTRHSFHDLQQVIHVSSQLQEQHNNKKSKTFCICSPCGLKAPLPNVLQRRPRGIQMGTGLYHRVLQRSIIYSDPEGILPQRLPSYYDTTVSSEETGLATKSSHAAWKTPERVLPVNPSCESVESIRCFSDTGYHHCDSRKVYMASPLIYQQSTVPSPLAYHIMAQATTIPSPLPYQHPTKTSSMPNNLVHQMAGPVTNSSSLHCSKALGSVETFAKRHADEVWVDGPPEFQVNRGAEFCQQIQFGSQSEDAEAKSTRKQRGFPVAKLSSSPRRSVDRKDGSVVSDSLTTRKSCSKLLRSTKDSEKTQSSALPKERVDASCNDRDCNAGRNCKIEKEKNKALTVVNASNLDRFCSFKQSSDFLASVSQFLVTESIKVPATLVKESDLIGPDHSTFSEEVCVLDSEKLAKEILYSRQKQALISNRESVYEVMLEETLEDRNLCKSPTLSADQLLEDDNFKHDPAVMESKIADHSQEDVTSIVTSDVKQCPSRKTEKALDHSAESTPPNSQDRHGYRPGNVITSSRKSFPYLGRQAIHSEFSFNKPRVGPSVVANNSTSCETGIQSPYSAVTQARPPASASSGLGSEVSSTVSFDVKMPAGWRNEFEYSSGYETVVRDSDSLVTTSQQLSGKKRSASKDMLIQNKYAQYDTMRSSVRSMSNTGFVSSSSARNNSSGVSISPEVLGRRVQFVIKGSTDCVVPSAAQMQKSVEPNAPEQKAMQILEVGSYQRALALKSTPASILRLANTGKKTSSYPTINHSYTCAVEDAQSSQVKDFKEPKRRNSSKSRMLKINCFNS